MTPRELVETIARDQVSYETARDAYIASGFCENEDDFQDFIVLMLEDDVNP